MLSRCPAFPFKWQQALEGYITHFQILSSLLPCVKWTRQSIWIFLHIYHNYPAHIFSYSYIWKWKGIRTNKELVHNTFFTFNPFCAQLHPFITSKKCISCVCCELQIIILDLARYVLGCDYLWLLYISLVSVTTMTCFLQRDPWTWNRHQNVMFFPWSNTMASWFACSVCTYT